MSGWQTTQALPAGEGTGEGAVSAAVADPSVPTASRGIAIHYGLPEYLAYADAHFEPASSGSQLVGLSVQYTYTTTGYLQQLSNAVDNAQVFWAANSQDAFGQITQETYGNGVVSDVAHNDPLGRISAITQVACRT